MTILHTSPLEREILTHYYTSPEPYKGGSEHWGKLHSEIVDKFVKLGLLERRPNPATGLLKVYGNDAALHVYMRALAAVRLPEQHWVIP